MHDFIAVFQKYKQSIYAYAFVRLGSRQSGRELAEDTAQEIFIKAFRNYHTFDPDRSSLQTWLYRIARNHIIDVQRKLTREQNYLATTSSDELEQVQGFIANSGNDKLQDSVLINFVYQKLSLLTEDERELIILHHIEGLKINEIAEIVQKRPTAVKVSVHRAFNKLKNLVNETV